MKKVILLAFCAGSTSPVNAQTIQTYLQAGGGAYACKQLMQPTADDDFGFGTAYEAGLLAGLTRNRWRFGLGAAVLTTMASRQMLVYFGDIVDPGTGKIVTEPIDTKFTERYRHLMIPVTVGYQFIKHRKLALTLVAGAAVSNNFAYDRKAEGQFLDGAWRRVSFTGSKLVKWSFWGTAGIEAGYQPGRQIQLVVSPEVWYMFSSFKKDTRRTQHPLAAGINVSFRYFLQ